MAHVEAGEGERAKQELRRAFTRSPNDAKLAGALAHVHGQLGENDQAALFIERAATLAPDEMPPQWEAADFLHRLRRFKPAAKFYERCLKLNPRELAASEGLARCRLEFGDEAGMTRAYEAAIHASPERPQSYWIYMRALQTLGRIEAALEVLDRGLTRLPNDKDLTEFVCSLTQFSDRFAAPAAQPKILAQHRALGAMIAPGGDRPARKFSNTPNPERPLRVGLLSGDYCFHACAFFLVPLVRGLDKARCTPVLFGTNPPDETTRNFARLAAYHDVSAISDDDLAAQVQLEGIDVLIECNGWTDRHRLPALAKRLAPVQATYLGYPNTTGVDAIDWRIVDTITDPAHADAWASERLLRLDGCFVCYGAPSTPSAEVQRPPLAGRPVVFGSFNRLAKVTDITLGLWAKVLAKTPNSRLVLKSETYDLSRAETIRRFHALGGDPARISFAPFEPDPARHLATYHTLDIALDTSPYNGTTTTCEALTMGVPVVTLAGAAHRSRVGASLLKAAGLDELVANTPEQYVHIASELAHNSERLGHLHATLAQSTLASPLCQGPAFATRFEAGIRTVWRHWCDAQTKGAS